MPIILMTPLQVKKQIALQAKQGRLGKNLSRHSLSERSGIPASTIKHFETTGNISLESLLALALVLDCLAPFAQLFAPSQPQSLYKKMKQRKRGRQ